MLIFSPCWGADTPGMLARFQFSMRCERISAECATSRSGCAYFSTPGIPNVLPYAHKWFAAINIGSGAQGASRTQPKSVSPCKTNICSQCQEPRQMHL